MVAARRKTIFGQNEQAFAVKTGSRNGRKIFFEQELTGVSKEKGGSERFTC